MFFLNARPLPRKILFVLSLAVLLLGAMLLTQKKADPVSLHSVPDHSVMDWQLEGEVLRVEIVNTPASIERGLSGRESLETDGMLFIFPQPTRAIFWMKEMRFPLDIIWIADGKIVGIEKNAQPPALGFMEDQIETFPAPGEIDMVLETKPGRLEE